MKSQNKTKITKNSQDARTTVLRSGNILSEILTLINHCYEIRFIEKISRPIDQKTRAQIVEKYAGIMQEIHIKMGNTPQVLQRINEK